MQYLLNEEMSLSVCMASDMLKNMILISSEVITVSPELNYSIIVPLILVTPSTN